MQGALLGIVSYKIEMFRHGFEVEEWLRRSSCALLTVEGSVIVKSVDCVNCVVFEH